MSLIARPWLAQIDAYRPGRPAPSEHGSLASNESALGASNKVSAALSTAAQRVHRYPDPLADELRAEIAQMHDVDPDQILVGNGSDELIYLLAWAYLAQTGHAVCASPAYRIDEISTYVVGARLTRVPLSEWAHDLEAMAEVHADLAYVVNPHNPTGTARSRAEIAHFAENCRASLVVVDEAYIDFADDPALITSLPLLTTGRVAVLRTFSKAHGLAGLRVGYLVAPPTVIETLRKIRPPFSVGALAQAGAVAAARDAEHHARVRAHTLRNRRVLTRQFEDAGYRVVPSQANFILVQVPDEDSLVTCLGRHGVAVRAGSALGIPGTVRVSVPSDDGLDLIATALRNEVHGLPVNHSPQSGLKESL